LSKERKSIAGAVMDRMRLFARNVVRDDMTLVLLRMSEKPPEDPA
jgi:hypothetical protein